MFSPCQYLIRAARLRFARKAEVVKLNLVSQMAEPLAFSESQKDWEKYAKKYGVLHTNILDLKILDSASRIKDPQFYALRVLWRRQDYLLPELEICDRETLAKTRKFLRSWQAWRDYLEDIESKMGDSSFSTVEDIGTFSLVRYNQMRTYLSPLPSHDYQEPDEYLDSAQPKVVPSPAVCRTRSNLATPATWGSPHTPTPMPRDQTGPGFNMERLRRAIDAEESPRSQGPNAPPSPESPANAAGTLPSEDEQIVNTALILLLDCLTIYHPDIRKGGFSSPRWTMKRLQLKCGTWEARTDGFLTMPGSKENIRAILETKPFVRNQNLKGIQKQESAQMAAWISQCPDDKFNGLRKEGSRFRWHAKSCI